MIDASASNRGGRLYGRGAYDMKAGLASIMLRAAARAGLAGDVIVTGVCDEEFASRSAGWRSGAPTRRS